MYRHFHVSVQRQQDTETMASSMFCYICWMKLFVFLLLAEITGSVGLTPAPVEEIHQEVGGTATFRCKGTGDVLFLYLQKQGEKVFLVDGYDYLNRPLEVPPMYWNRSYVNKENRTVILRDLRPADEGHYECIAKTNTDSDTEEKTYKLRVTANYSRPQVNVTRNDSASSCSVTCSSFGGYPQAAVEWVVRPRPDMFDLQNITQDPVTGLFSLFSEFVVNISRPLSVTCIVGNFSSETLQDVCA